jgi:hypothetical protein
MNAAERGVSMFTVLQSAPKWGRRGAVAQFEIHR